MSDADDDCRAINVCNCMPFVDRDVPGFWWPLLKHCAPAWAPAMLCPSRQPMFWSS